MGRRTVALGIASGLACALCVGLYAAQIGQEAQLQRAEALEKYGGVQVEAYVARRDLSAGEALDDSMVEKRQWLAELLPAGAVTDLESVRGQQLGSLVFAGEVLCEGRMQAQGNQLVVPEGLCAVSVPAKDVQTVGGSLVAGMEADLYMIGPSGSSLLASRVPVLAVGREGAASNSSWVTVAVRPSLVHELVQAAQSYVLYFALPGADEAQLQGDAAGGGEAPGDGDGLEGGPRDEASGAGATEEDQSAEGEDAWE